ncbi:MAG: helix-turn-helix transcriptional regulator [Phycisphaerae bacterium]
METRKRIIFTDSEWSTLTAEYSLSRRQNQILQAVFLGLENKEIGTRLKISYHTVRTHLKRLFIRFESANRTDLILNIFAVFRAKCRKTRCPLRG